MRLLFDHNLSPDLTTALADLYPQSLHVWNLEMDIAQVTDLLRRRYNDLAAFYRDDAAALLELS